MSRTRSDEIPLLERSKEEREGELPCRRNTGARVAPLPTRSGGITAVRSVKRYQSFSTLRDEEDLEASSCGYEDNAVQEDTD